MRCCLLNIVYISKASDIDEVLKNWQKKLPLTVKRKIVKDKIFFEKQGEKIECKAFYFNKTKDKVYENIGEKIKSIIVANEYRNVVVSNEIKNNDMIMENLKELNILDGRWLFNYLLNDIIRYILQKKNKEINQCEISILVNKTTDTNVQNILNIAQSAKVLNIVTQNLDVFKQIEDRLYDEKGIMIRVTNNKKRSLLRSDIIVNLDFLETELEKYYLPSKRNCN